MVFEDILTKIEESHGKQGRVVVQEAFEFMREAHKGQMRAAGDEFWTHPAAVATILVSQNYTDPELIAGALLHDTVEDTKVTLEDVKERFGSAVAFIVEAVTDVGRGDGEVFIQDKYERMAKTQEKILRMGQQDSRIFLVKTADRLHNLRTIDALSEEQINRIKKESRDFHLPLAQKAGADELAQEIEQLSSTSSQSQ